MQSLRAKQLSQDKLKQLGIDSENWEDEETSDLNVSKNDGMLSMHLSYGCVCVCVFTSPCAYSELLA